MRPEIKIFVTDISHELYRTTFTLLGERIGIVCSFYVYSDSLWACDLEKQDV